MKASPSRASRRPAPSGRPRSNVFSRSSDIAAERLLELLHAEAAEAAAGRLRLFSEYVFRLTPPDHMTPVIEALEAVERGELRRLLVILPPGHTKSTYVSLVFPAWFIGRHPDAHLIGVSTTDRLATTFGETVRTVIEQSPEFARVFPEVRPDFDRGWSKDGFFVTRPWAPFDKDPTGFYAGAGGSVIGRRADGIVADDLIDLPEARSETLLEARKTWFRQVTRTRLKPKGWIVVAGTLWVEDDIVDSLDKAGEYVTIRMRARSEGRQVHASVSIPDAVSWRPAGARIAGQLTAGRARR